MALKTRVVPRVSVDALHRRRAARKGVSIRLDGSGWETTTSRNRGWQRYMTAGWHLALKEYYRSCDQRTPEAGGAAGGYVSSSEYLSVLRLKSPEGQRYMQVLGCVVTHCPRATRSLISRKTEDADRESFCAQNSARFTTSAPPSERKNGCF